MAIRSTRGGPRAAFVMAAILGGTAAHAAACSSTGNPEPPVFSATTSGTGGAGQGGAGQGGAGGVDPACVGEDGCYACDPTNDPEFLNACTEAQCSAFDNEARLPLYNGGDLPPVP